MTKLDIKPIGNRIIVKQETKTESGIILTNSRGSGQNMWGEIISLPDHYKTSIHMMKLELGGKVLFKSFETDKSEEFSVVEVEPDSGSRQGQVLAYEPPERKKDNIEELL
jgi:co-chaperonin GroES (HSP10)